MSDDNKFDYPHFQGKAMANLSFTVTHNVRRALVVRCLELEVTMNAHNAVRFLAFLSEHGDQLQAMSKELDQIALEADLNDQAHIAHEWRDYRNDGLGSGG